MSRAGRKDALPKTQARLEYCLSDRDLEPLSYEEKKNPVMKKGAPMKLYSRSDLCKAAMEKYGSEEGLAEERQKRLEKRSERARAQGKLDSFIAWQTKGPCPAGTDPSPEVPAADGTLKDPMDASPEALSSGGSLPPMLAERVMVIRRAADSADGVAEQLSEENSGPVVMYWMKAALRGHHNPALDAARLEAQRRGCPLVVAAPLLLDYQYATSRRTQFVLEGLRDAQEELRAQGIELLVHLPEPPSCEEESQTTREELHSQAWEALMSLVRLSCVVVAEDMPVPPESGWLDRLSTEAPKHTEIWAVDCACIYPARKAGKAYEKAYAYRSATEGGRKQRLGNSCLYKDSPDLSMFAGTEPLPPVEVQSVAKNLRWTPANLSEVDIQGYVLSNQLVDQSVLPVKHMPGGSKAAYQRWDQFRQIGGLGNYASTRNNAMNRNGTSRMSPYLRWGMVSPFQMAKDAATSRKFLDEFLVWRELSYAFCMHKTSAELHSLSALPNWAQETLKSHADDPKEILPAETLEKGQTGDEFWDAAQTQLVVTGELHNNVRMTWGKAFLSWSPSPEEALARALHNNHKFALDGCDPCSYGGILWCFGQFDGPKAASSTPIFGSVRQRPTGSHGRRLPPLEYSKLPADA